MVVIRWTGVTFISGYPVDFQTVLKRNGTIFFVYRAVRGRLSPTIGLSAGDGTNGVLGAFNGVIRIRARYRERFRWRPALPNGLSFSAGGVLSGASDSPFTGTVSVLVRDEATPARQAAATLSLEIQ